MCVDIFDTLLTRSVGEPAAVYLLLGQRVRNLPGALSPELFARARALAENRARAHVRTPKDITLAGIYAELTLAYPTLHPLQSELMAHELALEASLIQPIPGANDFVEQVRRRSQQVAFVSDMYLPQEFLQAQLERHGLWQPTDRLFVSSACGCMKGRDGALFQHVLDVLNVQPEAGLHVGNNWTDDYVEARNRGLHAVFFPAANLNHFEKTLEQHRWENAGASSLMAGASRMARLSQPTHNDHERALVEVAAGVGGPLMVAFSLWMLQRAQAHGITRLYYLAREGQIMHSLATLLCQRLGLAIENRYLYVSRRALNLALLDNYNEHDLQWALTHHHEQDLTTILARLSLTPDDLAKPLEGVGLTRETWNGPLTDEQRSQLLRLLNQDPSRSLIQQRSQAARKLAEGYLQQEGVFDAKLCGLVDSGGLGSQMRTLGRLRSLRGLPPTTGFAVYRDGDPSLPLDNFPALHVYMRDVTYGQGQVRVKGMWETLETLCSADHGTVFGYEMKGSELVPCVVPGRTERIQAWGLPLVHDTLRSFAEAIVLDPKVTHTAWVTDAREALSAALKLFWNKPLPHEAAAWGSFPWEPEAGTAEGTLAAPLPPGKALGLLLNNPNHDQVWPAGAESRSPFVIRSTLKLGRRVPVPVRKLLRTSLRWFKRAKR